MPLPPARGEVGRGGRASRGLRRPRRRMRLALAAGAGLALLAGCSHPEPLRPGDWLPASERPGDGAPVVSWVDPSWRPPPNRVADALARRMSPAGSLPKARRALAREIEAVLLRVRNEYPEADARELPPILEGIVPNTFVVVLRADLSATVRRRLLHESDRPMALRTGNAAFDSFNERNGLSKVSILELEDAVLVRKVLEGARFLFHFEHPVDFGPLLTDFLIDDPLMNWMFSRYHHPYVAREEPGFYMEGVKGVDAARYDWGHAAHEGVVRREDTHGRSYFGDNSNVTLTRSNGTWCLVVREFLDWGLYLHHQFTVEGDEVKRIHHDQDAGECAAVFG